uniref:Uncharacterized protein n=1 Tax=Panagrolaimus sp. JU765 TaxID=591449 RepID=A0AC34RHP9_9BILA
MYKNATDDLKNAKTIAETLLAEETPSTLQLTKAADLVHDAMQEAENLANQPDGQAAGPLFALLDSEKQELQAVAEKLEDKLVQTGQLQTFVAEAYAIIDPLKDHVQSIEQAALFDLNEARNQLEKLNKTLPNQQRLAELSQLIRDLSSTEPVLPHIDRARDTVAVFQDGLRREIEDEEREAQKQADLEDTFNNLEVSE